MSRDSARLYLWETHTVFFEGKFKWQCEYTAETCRWFTLTEGYEKGAHIQFRPYSVSDFSVWDVVRKDWNILLGDVSYARPIHAPARRRQAR